ncbi:MAG TPA: nitroreductase family protein [Flexivirga sp.]|uniref:nitroreductase family protein n=1 Tax=Flexivirga sp. TaxID=1962927 RepID=UPI002CBCDF46|nr:nitroreductase family protein [Flexivirga sp.]HWC20778.1 nitroreductase family protein [Flexivirga sp.]
MELRDAVLRRRMVRRFDPEQDVPPETVRRLLELAVRAPSAGFSQGWDFLVLRGTDRDAFWAATTDDGIPDSWLRGVSAAPVLIVCCSDKNTYLRRYARDDKPWQDESEEHWPVPYWDVDTGMAALLMLLGAVDEGLGGLFFGVPVERLDTVREAFGIPADRGIVGVVAIGHPAESKPSGSTRAVRRRDVGEVAHFGRFGVTRAE